MWLLEPNPLLDQIPKYYHRDFTTISACVSLERQLLKELAHYGECLTYHGDSGKFYLCSRRPDLVVWPYALPREVCESIVNQIVPKRPILRKRRSTTYGHRVALKRRNLRLWLHQHRCATIGNRGMDDAVLEYTVAVPDENRKKSKGRPPKKEVQALQEAERYGVEIARLQGEGESHVHAVHWVAQTYHVGDRTVENRWRLFKDEIAEQVLWLIRREHTEEAAIKTVADSLETNEKTVRIAYSGWKNKNPGV